ncbi:hypothetical protein [Sphingomonas qomolangmaensis]|uniref:Uncharacterized protein n=1 Tax=Sphingomonas qomolangmaensis TaxID=2918765 RepID=A0ABY5L851_9SPHN|nr:hypothetical protein [Sphingomonas qomolangmaensis]UUL83150.1 hypothetical protein NMP03_02630 [Sphingomonas qomolangmaensis]
MPHNPDPSLIEAWPNQMLQAAAAAQHLQYMFATQWWTMAMAPGLLAFPRNWAGRFDHQLPVPDPIERDDERALFA